MLKHNYIFSITAINLTVTFIIIYYILNLFDFLYNQSLTSIHNLLLIIISI